MPTNATGMPASLALTFRARFSFLYSSKDIVLWGGPVAVSDEYSLLGRSTVEWWSWFPSASLQVVICLHTAAVPYTHLELTPSPCRKEDFGRNIL